MIIFQEQRTFSSMKPSNFMSIKSRFRSEIACNKHNILHLLYIALQSSCSCNGTNSWQRPQICVHSFESYRRIQDGHCDFDRAMSSVSCVTVLSDFLKLSLYLILSLSLPLSSSHNTG